MLQVLPARIGEIIRAYLVGKQHSISKTASFSSIIVERIFDGTFVMIIFALALYVYPGNLEISIPGAPEFSLKRIIVIFTSLYVGALLFVLLLKIFPALSGKVIGYLLHFFSPRIKDRAGRILENFIAGLSIFHNMKYLCLSGLTTAIIWLLVSFSYYVLLMAFRIHAPFYFSFILMGFIIIAVMIPSAPGFIGVFHFVVQLTLQKFFNASPAVALSFAWVSWFLGLLVCVVVGMYYFNQYHLHMRNIEEGQEELEMDNVAT